LAYREAYLDEDVEAVKLAVSLSQNEKLVQTFNQILEKTSINNKT